MTHGQRTFLRRTIAALGISTGLACMAPLVHAQGDRTTSNPFDQLQYRFIGPQGNRAASIVGVPGDPLTIYVGAASGGIFKTTDAGNTWAPIFDNQEVSAVGALAVADSAHDIVWAGTGEPWLIRPFAAMGDGVYKSTDAGHTWSHMGLDETGHIARIIIDPRNPDVVFTCAVGQAYRPQKERGIFKTTDGGKTWQQVLFVNESTGCSELAMDPHDPQTLFAGMWQLDIKTWKLDSGGTGGGVFVTHDGGATWKKLVGNGLPAADHPVGKVAVAIAASNPNRVYALMQDHPPSLFRSDDRGQTWTMVNHAYVLSDRFTYYTRFAVSPDDQNLLYFVSTAWSVSRDGGETLARNVKSAGGDLHDIWIDPTNPNRFMVSDDGGGSFTYNRGQTYERIVLPIAQMYHVYTDNNVPYYVYGNRQDGPSFRGPSNNLEGSSGGISSGGRGVISTGDWIHVGGCESGFTIPDPVDSNIIWSGCYNGDVTRTDLRTGQSHMVSVWPDAAYGWAPAEGVKHRWHWTFPIAISPHDHNKVYVGSQAVSMTTNGGKSWTPISPDLTTNDKSHQQDSGGITTDNLMTFDGSVLYAIAESPVQAGVIWTGSNDGQINVTRDGGKNWTNVTKNIANLPPWGTVFNVEPSHFDAGTAYLTYNLQHVGNYDPLAYKTSDFGRTWKLVTASVPKSVSSFTHCIREDPVRKGMLYLATDNSIYISWDDGDHWTKMRNNMPPAPVYWLEIQPQFNDLVVGTYGRGFYILDDITPLREWDKAQATDVYLFKPRQAFRFRRFDTERDVERGAQIAGQNPPDGTDFNFSLKAPTSVEIAVLGPGGEAIRTLKVAGKAGINRVWWNMQYEPTHTVKLRVPPPNYPWAKPGPDGWRPFTGWIVNSGAPQVPPGTYTVRLRANGKELTQPLTVLKDPKTLGTDQELKAGVDFLLQVHKDLNEVVDIANRVEWMRKQIADIQTLLGDDPKNAAAVKAAQELEQKAAAAEGEFIDIWTTSAGGKEGFREPIKLYGKLANLASMMEGTLPGLDTGSNADYPPTEQQVAVYKELQQKLAEARRGFQELTTTTAPAFNAFLKAQHLSLAIEP